MSRTQTIRYGIPGPGGSLGLCPVCGENFLKEILLGDAVAVLKLSLLDVEVPVHKKCGDAVLAHQGAWGEVRDKFPEGPLKEAFEAEYREQMLEKTI